MSVGKLFWADYGICRIRPEPTTFAYKFIIEKVGFNLTYSTDPASIPQLLNYKWDVIMITDIWFPNTENREDISHLIYPLDSLMGNSHFPEADPPLDIVIQHLIFMEKIDTIKLPPELRNIIIEYSTDQGLDFYSNAIRYEEFAKRIEDAAQNYLNDYQNIGDIRQLIHRTKLEWTSGLYLAEKIRFGVNKETPLIILTHSRREGTEKAVSEFGNSYLMREPFSPPSLYEELEGIISKF